MKNYKLIFDTNLENFTTRINKYLDNGYLCQGNPFTTGDGYCFYQAIYKPITKTENEK